LETVVRQVAQLAMGAVFAVAATAKLARPVGFARGVVDYRVIPDRLAFALGLFLIPLELFVAVTHLTGYWVTVGAPLSLVLLAGFIFAVAVNIKRGRGIACHCFGGEDSEAISPQLLVRLGIMFLAEGALVVRLDLFYDGVSHPISMSLNTQGASLIGWVVFTVIVSAWSVRTPELFTLLSSWSRHRIPELQPSSARELK
jgi:hypothetical protein